MIDRFTRRPRVRSRIPLFFYTLPRSARRRGQAWVFAVLIGLGQGAQAVGGDPDPSFGDDGRVTTDLSDAGRADSANDLAIQFDDKIIVVGTREKVGGEQDVAVLRYNPDGMPDEGFGQSGVVIEDLFGDQDASADGVVLQRDGKIVVVGAALNRSNGPENRPPGVQDFLVARFNLLDGTLDHTFGGGQGFVTTAFGPGSDDFARAAVLQADGRIVAAGRSNAGGSADFALARYNTDGSLDDGGPGDLTPGDRFGANGRVTTDFAAGNLNDSAIALALDADGRLVAAGCRSCDSSESDFALARYLSDGQLDPSLHGDGKVSTDLAGDDDARGLAIQASDGKIVAGGGAGEAFGVARYFSDGSLDTGFDGDGRVTTEFGFAGRDSANALIVQPDGRIVAAGRSNVGGFFDPAALALAQYLPDGSLDNSFGVGGKVLTCLSPARAEVPCDDADLETVTRARAVVLDRNGKLVVAGFFASEANPQNSEAFDFLVARYNRAIMVSEVLCQGKTPDFFGSPEQTTLRGTPGDDVIVGSVAGDFIIGGGGNDTICGGPGEDLIFGQGGDDAIEGGDGDDTVIGGPGADVMRGGPGGDTIFGEDDVDLMEGEDGNDRLFGGAGADVMSGGPGVDTVFGEGDVDTVQGDDGDDKLFGGTDADVLRGGPGGDEIFGEDDGDTVEGEDGDDHLFGGTGADRLAGGPGRDTVFGEEGSDTTIEGGDDDDTLVGGPGADVMRGGFGGDTVFGGDDSDTIEGGDGADELVGGEGDDQVDGGNDDDELFGAGGNDVLLGGPGGDTLVGEDGSDTLDGGPGRDMAFGGSGKDELRGGDQKDTLLGEADNDRMFGGPGNDVLFGGRGGDNMRGNVGKDDMVGERGRDRANGGAGADTCFSTERSVSCDPGERPPRKPNAPERPVPPTTGNPDRPIPPPPCASPGCGG